MVYADKMIRLIIRCVESLKNNQKINKLLESITAVKEMKFRSIALTDYNKAISLIEIRS